MQCWTPTSINSLINCSEFREGPPGWSRGTGALDLWEETEGAGLMQLGAERALGNPSSSLSACGEVTEQMEAVHTTVCGRVQEASGLRWNERFRLKIRRNSFTMTAKQWASCPKRLCSFHPWRFSKTYLDKALSNQVWLQRWLCFQHEAGLETFLDPFQRELFCKSVMCTISTYCHRFTFWYCSRVGKGNNWKDLLKTKWAELWCTHELSGNVKTVHQHIQLQSVDHSLRYVRFCLLWSSSLS